MKKVNFEKVAAGDLVQVPRYQFAPMRYGWNGWLFSDAVVLSKGFGKKSGKPVITVEMRTPGKVRNDYGTCEKIFFADCVFKTNSVETAKKFMQMDGVSTKEEFEIFRAREDVTGCDWIKFLVDRGYLFNDSEAPEPDRGGPEGMTMTEIKKMYQKMGRAINKDRKENGRCALGFYMTARAMEKGEATVNCGYLEETRQSTEENMKSVTEDQRFKDFLAAVGGRWGREEKREGGRTILYIRLLYPKGE